MTLEKHGLPWQLSGKEFTGQAGDPGLTLDQEDPLEKEMATPVLLPGEFHGQRSQRGYSPWDCKEMDCVTNFHFLFTSSKCTMGIQRPMKVSLLEVFNLSQWKP